MQRKTSFPAARTSSSSLPLMHPCAAASLCLLSLRLLLLLLLAACLLAEVSECSVCKQEDFPLALSLARLRPAAASSHLSMKRARGSKGIAAGSGGSAASASAGASAAAAASSAAAASAVTSNGEPMDPQHDSMEDAQHEGQQDTSATQADRPIAVTSCSG